MAELNVKHFNKILDHIRGDLLRLWMPAWGIKKGTKAARGEGVRTFASCGTACCFAGWSRLLSLPRSKWNAEFYDGSMFLMDRGRDREAARLGLTVNEGLGLFGPVGGTRRSQFSEVKRRLRYIIAKRVEAGEASAKMIRV